MATHIQHLLLKAGFDVSNTLAGLLIEGLKLVLNRVQVFRDLCDPGCLCFFNAQAHIAKLGLGVVACALNQRKLCLQAVSGFSAGFVGFMPTLGFALGFRPMFDRILAFGIYASATLLQGVFGAGKIRYW